MNSVLFICSANICRSPMAMGLLQARLAMEAQEWRIESAGVWAQDGSPAAPFTQKVVLRSGVDLAGHRSRLVTGAMLREFNLVLTMEQGQQEALRMAFPQYAAKVLMMSELVNERHDVADPVGGPLYDYEITANELNDIFERGMLQLRRLASDSAF